MGGPLADFLVERIQLDRQAAERIAAALHPSETQLRELTLPPPEEVGAHRLAVLQEIFAAAGNTVKEQAKAAFAARLKSVLEEKLAGPSIGSFLSTNVTVSAHRTPAALPHTCHAPRHVP